MVSTYTQKSSKSFIVWIVVLALIAAVTYYFYTNKGANSADNAGSQQTPEVEVQILKQSNQRVWNDFSGTLRATEMVEVRPLVGGTITDIKFSDGQKVERGDSLFVIDTRPYEATLATAIAARESAKSQSELSRLELDRARKLIKDKNISQSVLDARKRDYQVTQAAIKAAEAEVTRARLNIEYAHIKSPISGQVSRPEITVGNVVESGPSAPVLTRIVAKDALYAEFDVDEQTYISAVRNSEQGEMPVEMQLTGDNSVVYRGTIYSFDNQLDTASGTIRARAIFKNTDNALMPGMFANIRMGGAAKQNLLLVQDKAVGTDQNKKFVYVITPENKVEYREITLGSSIGANRIVKEGLKAGEKVVVNSLQKVRSGMDVKPVNIASKDKDESGIIIGEAQNSAGSQTKDPQDKHSENSSSLDEDK